MRGIRRCMNSVTAEDSFHGFAKSRKEYCASPVVPLTGISDRYNGLFNMAKRNWPIGPEATILLPTDKELSIENKTHWPRRSGIYTR